MNLLWICGARIVGGAERATLNICSLLRERGHAVGVACRPDSRLHALLTDLRFPIQPAPLGGALNLRAPLAITRLMAAATPDVALVTTADEWVWACLGPRATQTHLVLVRHMALPLSWRVRWLAGRRADAVVAVSEAVRTSLSGRAGIAPQQLHVIYNPVRFTPRLTLPDAAERGRARASLGVPTDGRWVGFFGGLDPNKGIADVARAVRHANAAIGPMRMLLCGRRGDGAEVSARELARTHNLEGRLYDLGEIERVEDALTAVDLVVMATRSRLNEALPATLIEAMACGTPVLAYATGGMSEVIGADGEAGRLARADDADDLARVLIEVLRDPISADRMARAALARARTLFDPAQAADRYEQLFSTLPSRAATSRPT